jgi:[FeFe] hydrogenase H-cluster maturation GTPase HydF
MDETPKANRLHIAIFGRTNVGKSSLLNLLAGQDIAITSPVAGTTTDVVEKALELRPLGPVLIMDTAGLDATSALAELRIEKTKKVFDRADVALLVTEPGTWTDFEESIVDESKMRRLPLLVAVNKIDREKPSSSFLEKLRGKAGSVIALTCKDPLKRQEYMEALQGLLLKLAPEDFFRAPSLIAGLLPPGGLVVLVVPLDLQAPKGRLIFPQVQTIRDALDSDAICLVVKEPELLCALDGLKRSPDLVVTDSQALQKVCADVPAEIPLTTFSILMARQKGDLAVQAEGAAVIETLRPGDRVLIAEACSHHAPEDDIGRVKIPRWLSQYVGGEIEIETFAGRDYPENLADFKLVIHCGGCMLNRKEMLSRLKKAQQAGVPVTSYGVAVAFLQGVILRTLAPFPSALLAFERRAAGPANSGQTSQES